MVELSDYQEISRDFLLERSFALLADSPGVGKTAPTLVAGYRRAQEKNLPVLVTAPAYLLGNWEREISRFAPGARVVIANGKGYKERYDALQADADFILTGYYNWSAKSAGGFIYWELTEREWAAVVFDEGHRLRGRNSQCTKHVLGLRGRKAANVRTPVWVLTGTPVINNPGDLFPLLRLWDSSRRSYWKFVEEWCKVVKTPWGTEVGQLLPGKEDEFQALLSGFTMRRTLREIPSLSLLDEYHRDYLVHLPPSVRKTIATARKDYIVEHSDLSESEYLSGAGALYARLRQLATNPPTAEKPKTDLLRDLLEDCPGRVVCYTWYKDSARVVAEQLAKTKRPVTLITGDVPADDRKELVDKWANTNTDASILVATISSLKEGISLTAASTVIFLEHSELPADQEQCIARLKRRGQTELVKVHHIWALGSPDISIKKMLEEREGGITRAVRTWLREED